MMTAEDVIAAWIADVAARLPRARRADTAFELRALLAEQLQDHADAAGRPADAAMALALVRSFGEPGDVADRYRTPVTIIDPADGARFLRWAGGGLALIWALGLIAVIRDGAGEHALTLAGHWWTGTVIPSLWWPGLLVVVFALAAWSRRRAAPPTWTPRAPDAIHGGRGAVALGLVGMVLGLAVLFEPTRVLDIFWGGAAAPAAHSALTYTEAFLRMTGPVLFVLVAANVPIAAWVLVTGRHSRNLRRLETVVAVLTCAAMAWAIAGGPILAVPHADQTAKGLLTLLLLALAAGAAMAAWRRVRPAPAPTPVL